MGKYKKLYKLQLENEKRFDIIEKHLGLNTEATVSKMESVEKLPEKWCVKYEHSQLEIIVGFLNWKCGANTKSGYLCKEAKKINCFFITDLKPKTYTEITFDQFKKWVLKEEEQLALSNSEVSLSIREVQVKVTSQEEANECAEIAKACGEKVNYKDASLDVDDLNKYFKYGIAELFVGQKSDTKTEISIQEYRERFGKADVSKLETTEIDWSKAGQLVKGSYTTAITNGTHEDKTFTAFVIKVDDDSDINHLCSTLIKEKFKLCTEPITLKNE